VKDPGRIVERLVDGHRIFGEPGPDQVLDPRIQRGLLRPEPVERPPRLGDELRRVLERLLARRVEAQRPFRFVHLPDSRTTLLATPGGSAARGARPAPAPAL